MCLSPKYIINKYRFFPDDPPYIRVSCGKCIECLVVRANEWAGRLVDEMKQHKEFFFLTLTYNEKFVPIDYKLDDVLNRSDIQKFFKLLRRKIYPRKVRFFYCGEYGTKGKRPHYHAAVFGWCPSDLKFNRMVDGLPYYTSDFISSCWQNFPSNDRLPESLGFHLLSPHLTKDNLRYCAKYMQKLNPVDKSVDPFTGCSLKPGIGAASVDTWSISTTDKVYHEGKAFQAPRYYLKLCERDGIDLTDLKRQRISLALACEKVFSPFERSVKLKKSRKFTNGS